jgi:hypothetical protein
MSEIAHVIRAYDDEIKIKLRNDLKEKLGHYGEFEDDVWIQTKYKGYSKANEFGYSIHFLQIPEQYKEIIKYYVIRYFKAPKTNDKYAHYLTKFCKFLVNEYNGVSLTGIDYKLLKDYKHYILESSLSDRTKEMALLYVKSFFERMDDFEEVPNVSFPDINFKLKKNNNKDIEDIDGHVTHVPSKVLYDLDRVFLDFQDNIPIHIQLIYWLLRLIPSRIGEILNISTQNCLRKFGRDKYIITIPSPKTSHSLTKCKQKMIYINNVANVEKHLLLLMLKQIEISNNLQNLVHNTYDVDELKSYGIINKDNFANDLLFTTNIINRKNKLSLEYTKKKTISNRYNMDNFNRYIKVLVKYADGLKNSLNHNNYNFRNKNENIYNFSSHSLRHEGITSRIDSGLFQLHDIMFVSGLDTEDTIWNSYYSSAPKSVIKTKEIYAPNSNNQFENSIFSPEEKEILEFQGNPKLSESLLRLNQRIRRNAPIIDNSGNYLGNCRGDFYSCKNLNSNCINCSFAKTSSPCHIENLKNAVNFFENEVKFLKEKSSLFQMDIAQEKLNAYKNRLKELT